MCGYQIYDFSVAGGTRRDIEKRSGRPVVTGEVEG